MPRSARVIDLFRYATGFITIISVVFTVEAIFGQISTFKDLVVFMVLLVVSIIGSGLISLQYISILKWFLLHLHITEDHRWVVGLGISAICDVLLLRHNMVAVMVLSVLSMIVICVVAAGWDCDRSGMTEGLFIGFGKLLLINLLFRKTFSSILCGLVLLLAVASKFTEGSVGTTAGNSVPVGSADGSRPTAGV